MHNCIYIRIYNVIVDFAVSFTFMSYGTRFYIISLNFRYQVIFSVEFNNNFTVKNIISSTMQCHRFALSRSNSIDFSHRFANIWRGPRDFLLSALTIRFTLARLRLPVRCLRIIIFHQRRRAMRSLWMLGWLRKR